jgi:hypothetical protein
MMIKKYILVAGTPKKTNYDVFLNNDKPCLLIFRFLRVLEGKIKRKTVYE